MFHWKFIMKGRLSHLSGCQNRRFLRSSWGWELGLVFFSNSQLMAEILHHLKCKKLYK